MKSDEARELLRECWEMIDYLRTEANLQYGRGLQKRILKFLAQPKAAPQEQQATDSPRSRGEVPASAAPDSGEGMTNESQHLRRGND